MAKGKTVDWGAYRSDKGKKFVAKAKSLGFEWGESNNALLSFSRASAGLRHGER
nr:hypothetical protein [Listeria monocytogenes]